MPSNEQLISFFRNELISEKATNWARLKRIPDTRVWRNLRLYETLNDIERVSFLDCLAGMACANYGFILDLPEYDHGSHPFFGRWRHAMCGFMDGYFDKKFQSVPALRTAIAQFKIDTAKGKPSCVTNELYEYALSVHGMKAPALRKRVKEAFVSIGLQKIEKHGGGIYIYHCVMVGTAFKVVIDYGGRSAQLRYHVALLEFESRRGENRFSLDRAFGFGFGDWDFIIEENLENSVQMLCEAVRYSVALPDKVRNYTM
jgi:hypothetical protein